MFKNATSFDSDLSQWDMSKVKTKTDMFLNDTATKASKGFKFTSNDQLKEAAREWVQDKEKAREKYGKIEDWDVSKVTSFERLFEYGGDFNEDLSLWDVSNVTNMFCAFGECRAFNSDLSTWNTSNCTNMGSMFGDCEAFNSDISTWNTSNCTSMWIMFNNATSFDSDLSQWNMSKVEDKRDMFLDATAMKASHKPKGVD
jgi:surface protein